MGQCHTTNRQFNHECQLKQINISENTLLITYTITPLKLREKYSLISSRTRFFFKAVNTRKKTPLKKKENKIEKKKEERFCLKRVLISILLECKLLHILQPTEADYLPLLLINKNRMKTFKYFYTMHYRSRKKKFKKKKETSFENIFIFCLFSISTFNFQN